MIIITIIDMAFVLFVGFFYICDNALFKLNYMKKILLVISVAFFSCVLFAQTRAELYAIYQKSIEENDSVALVSLIEKWEDMYPHDADLYTIKVNYYFNNSVQNVLLFSDTIPAGDVRYLSIKDENGKEFYSYFEKRVVDEEMYLLAIKTFDEAIRMHPNRLDIRAGLIHTNLQLKQYEPAVQQILSTIEHSAKNDNDWTWTHDSIADPDGYIFLRDILCDYMNQMINADEIVLMEKVLDTCLRIYPKDEVFMNSKGVITHLSGNLQEALKWYLKAYQQAPNDIVVLSNVASTYYNLGDKENAIKYYRIVAQCGIEEYVQQANYIIEELTAQ